MHNSVSGFVCQFRSKIGRNFFQEIGGSWKQNQVLGFYECIWINRRVRRIRVGFLEEQFGFFGRRRFVTFSGSVVRRWGFLVGFLWPRRLLGFSAAVANGFSAAVARVSPLWTAATALNGSPHTHLCILVFLRFFCSFKQGCLEKWLEKWVYFSSSMCSRRFALITCKNHS